MEEKVEPVSTFGAYIREGTTSRVTAANRPYGKFYDFYSVSLETFGSTHVQIIWWKKLLLLNQYCSGDQIKKNKMGGACRMYGGKERHIQGFGGETQRKETTQETQA